MNTGRGSPAYSEAGAAIALGQAFYDRRTAVGWSQEDLARQGEITLDEVERIEGGVVSIEDAETRVSFGHTPRRRKLEG